MKQISLDRIQLKGFKSFVNESELDLSQFAPGLILINGKNLAEPRLGANGVGKSSTFDGLCFILWGTSVRNVRINDLVSYGKKQAVGVADFTVDGQKVTIQRSGPPSRIMINGAAAEQADIDAIIGMSKVRFLNSVMFGQAAPLFIDLAVPQRGELLDEILDLQLWMRAADKATKAHAIATSDLNKTHLAISRVEGAKEALGSIDVVVAEEEAWKAQQETRLEGVLVSVEETETELEVLKTKSISTATIDVAPLWDAYTKLRNEEQALVTERAKSEQLHGLVIKDIEFFKKHDLCPTCLQPITKEFSDNHLAHQIEEDRKLMATLTTIDQRLANVKAAANEAHTKHQNAKAANAETAQAVALAKNAVTFAEKQLDTLEKRAVAINEETNPYTSRRIKIENDLIELESNLASFNEAEQSLKSKLAALDFWRQAFRRVRLFCMNRTLKQLEMETMNAASSLGLIGWEITYATETETKSGTIKTGVQIEVKSPTMSGAFSAWSGGEGQRIRLCVALGLAGLIQRWSGVRWDIEVLDEPTAWLSETGIEDLLELLKIRADAHQKRVLVCDHRGLQFASIDRVVTVIKDEKGSHFGTA